MILPNRCLLKLNLLKIKIYWMKTDIKHILSASVWKEMSRWRGKVWLRTQMLRAEWSRSKWITNFPTGEDAGQRLRNEAEYLTVDKFHINVEYIIADAWKMNNNAGGLVLIIFSNLFQYQLLKMLNWL